MELDARTAPDGLTLASDVCIVGGGPAGLVLADQLQASGWHVVLLESGGYDRNPEAEELNSGASIGDPYPDLRLSRARGIGGTSAIWNNVVDGAVFAKYVPLDAIDFKSRDGFELSGWAFSRGSLEPQYRRAQGLCGLGALDYSGSAWSDPQHPLLELTGGTLTNSVYQFGSRDRFTVELPATLAAASTVTLVHGATVMHLSQSGNGDRITEARWATFSGRHGVARASVFVLAGGGIENARLLLLAFGDRPWLGRGFMEHPVDSSLELTSRAPAIHPAAGFYSTHTAQAGGQVLGRIGMSGELLESERLRNASLRLVADDEPRMLQSAGWRPVARRLVPLPAVRRLIGGTVKRAARLRRPRSTRYQLLMDLEQGPNPDNRIVLSDRIDRLGQRKAELHWRWRRADQANLERLRVVIARELQRSGVGKVRCIAGTILNPSAHHHAGTTRMHPDPAQGVVDENLRLHGMENLYVTGSSVFPTAGVANPTLTAIALTLRLGDHLAPRRTLHPRDRAP